MKIPFNFTYTNSKVLEDISLAIEGENYIKHCLKQFGSLLKVDKSKLFLCPSCTDALEMIAILTDIKEGDEFILPSFTHPSTVNAFVLRGATPIFVDIDYKTLNLDPAKIEQKITDKTKLILPVHYAGFSCDMTSIMDLAKKHNVLVVEDAAQGLDSYYKKQHLGTIGDFGTISFHRTKNLSCDEGGLVIINNEKYLERAYKVYNFGTNRKEFQEGITPNYIWVDLGSSYQISNLLASVLYSNLRNLEDITKFRIKVWNKYYNFFKDESLVTVPSYTENHNGHIFYILVNPIYHRKVIKNLNQKGIEVCSHFEALHDSSMMQHLPYDALPITNLVTRSLIRLPLFYGIDNSTIEYISKEVLEEITKCQKLKN